MKFLNRYYLIGLCTILLGFTLYSCSDSTGPDDTRPLPEFSSIAAPGDSAHAFLSDQQFTQLNLEIDYMPGYEPTQQALDSLESFLGKRLNKSTINIESPTEIESGGQNAYDVEDIGAIEEEHRNHYTNYETAGSDTLWAYFVVVDGEFTEQNVLGIAYLNTSMAFFGPTIHENSGGIGQADRYKLEATVFNHEFGHNMGLVANGSEMQQDHQDEANGKHCTQENCLMYYTVETTDYTSILADSPIPDLLEHCIADIEANGGE